MPGVSTDHEQTKDQQNNKASSFFSWLRFLLILIVVFIFFKYVIGITVISGNSMTPTLEDNDIIITSNLIYTPERNDIVVYENDQGKHIIKRVIGLPNESVEIKDGIVFVEGKPQNENYTTGTPRNMDEVTIPENSYFLVGDNREPGESYDSRSGDVGPISKSQLTGKALFSLYPPRISFQ